MGGGYQKFLFCFFPARWCSIVYHRLGLACRKTDLGLASKWENWIGMGMDWREGGKVSIDCGIGYGIQIDYRTSTPTSAF